MGIKQILAITIGGLAITFLNMWAVERDAKLFNVDSQPKEEVVWR